MSDDQGPAQPDTKRATGQMTLDWNRGTRRDWIKQLIIPEFSYVDERGKTRRVVQTSTMKDFLRVLEEFARDGLPRCLKEETLWKAMGVSERTLRRAVAACIGKGLLTMDRSFYKHSASRYTIEWAAIKELLMEHPDTIGLVAPACEGYGAQSGQPASPRTGQNPTPAKADSTPVNEASTPVKLSGTPVKLSGTPVKLSETGGVHTTYRAGAVFEPCKRTSNRTMRDATDESDVVTVRHLSDSDVHQIAGLIPGQDTGGWGRTLTIQDFLDRDAVNRLWHLALKFGYVTPDKRARFFATAKLVQREYRQRTIRDPGAYFTARVKSQSWSEEEGDLRAARSALATLDDARARR